MENDIVAFLRREKPILEKEFGVEEIALFGSYARGDQTADSDIDILVKLREVKFSALARLLNYLEKKLQRRIDLVSKGPHLTERFFRIVNKSIIYA